MKSKIIAVGQGKQKDIPVYLRNEFHYICICQKVEIVQLRLKYMPSYFVRNSSENKLSRLLSFCNIKVLNHE
jgi:hypothetical protein